MFNTKLTDFDSNISVLVTSSSGVNLSAAYTFCEKIGKIVIIQIFLEDSTIVTGIIAKIPEKYAPKTQAWFPFYHINGSNYVARGIVYPNGSIEIVNNQNQPINNFQGRVIYSI